LHDPKVLGEFIEAMRSGKKVYESKSEAGLRRNKMDADIRILSTNLTEALQSYIERRLHFSLGRFGRRVGRVSVRITDVNALRGGADKVCHISAELLPSGGTLIQQAVDANLYAAIGRATEGIGHSFARALERNRERRRKRETVRFLRHQQS